MSVIIVMLAVAAGILNTVQSGANATLSKALGQPLLAALIVTIANAIVYLAAAPFLGLGWPATARFAGVPWWAWLGGLFGGVYVLTMIYFADRLGAAIFTGITVTAAIVTSTILDHYGLAGFAQHPAGIGRWAGCGLMIGGLLLVSVF